MASQQSKALSDDGSDDGKKRGYFAELIAAIQQGLHDKQDIHNRKVELCAKWGVKKIPKDLEVLMHASPEDIEAIRAHLLTKPVRSISGVSPIAIMTEPRWCPHGRCTYCPGGIGSPFGDVPQSYTGHEPATMRAIRNRFDAYFQVFNRLEYYVIAGHTPDKAELIVMGGTFPSYEWEYQELFIKKALQAMNDFGSLFYPDGEFDLDAFRDFFELPGDIHDKGRAQRIQEKMARLWERSTGVSLEDVQLDNENAMIRCVGMTLETRPDKRIASQADGMLRLGCTRVELGIQSVYDDQLEQVHRDHDTQDSINAIRLLKDMGFKINAHMMPGMPGWSYERDLEGLRKLFADENYRPDMLKIYPCLVMRGTPLYADYKAGRFIPMDTVTATKIIGEFLGEVPRYVRVMRVQRDIPTKMTEDGVDKTNLRQYVSDYMRDHGLVSDDIRSREVRTQVIEGPQLHVKEYAASGGTEFFLSIDTADDRLVGFCRMRFPNPGAREEITDSSAIIRELHVNGQAVMVGKHADPTRAQHKGFGKQLMAKAQEIALSHGKTKMVVISGIGVRGYYAKLGYHRQGPYMVKDL